MEDVYDYSGDLYAEYLYDLYSLTEDVLEGCNRRVSKPCKPNSHGFIWGKGRHLQQQRTRRVKQRRRTNSRKLDRDIKADIKRGENNPRCAVTGFKPLPAEWLIRDNYIKRKEREKAQRIMEKRRIKLRMKIRMLQVERDRITKEEEARERKMKLKYKKKDLSKRFKKGLVAHKENNDRGVQPKAISREVKEQAKHHLAILMNEESDEKKVKYIADLLLANKTKPGTLSEIDNEMKEEEERKEIVNQLLRKLPASLLEKVQSVTTNSRIKPEVAEEVQIASLLQTLTEAKRKLMGGTQKTKLGESVAVKAFDSKGYAQSFLKVQPLDKSEMAFPIVPFEICAWNHSLKYGMTSIVPCKEMFEYAFDVYTNGIFRGVNMYGSVIAGGCVSACLQPLSKYIVDHFKEYRQIIRTIRRMPLPYHVSDQIVDYYDVDYALANFREELQYIYFNSPNVTSDVDIFIMAETLEEAEMKLKRLFKNIKRRYKELGIEFVVARTANAVSFCSPRPFRNVQLVVSTLRTLDDFLLFCDLDCTSCVYDGRDVYMSPRSVRAFNKRCNVVSSQQYDSQNTIRSRMLKYAYRGFSTLIFDSKHTEDLEMIFKFVSLNMVNIDNFAKKRLSLLGEYTTDRPFFREKDTEESMRAHFQAKFVTCGKKLKDVWNSQGNERVELKMRWKWEDAQKSSANKGFLPKCYMCKNRAIPSVQLCKTDLTLCDSCMEKNKEMMDQWGRVKGLGDCVALVTGGRIKIGYYTALRLLRCGVTVIVTTRFPHDAALRYSKERTFEDWKHKLHIYGVDLRHLPSVNSFITHVLERYTRLDFLINNAAQTKRRPRAYYHEVAERERRLMGGELRQKYLIKDFTSDPFMIEAGKSAQGLLESSADLSGSAIVPVMTIGQVALDPSLPTSAALTQVPLHPMDLKERDDELFPPGLVDEHNEPLDLRPSTSWNQKIDEISTVELMEVQIVNSTVPFMFISSFAPLLKEAAAISNHKRAFIVNVTAVEGMFSFNKKNGGHPHTNMAKAALNMMTKSIAETFAQDNIFASAVDTGWCTEMRYVPMHKRDEKGAPRRPVPLTDRDGAARVLHPIYVGLRTTPPYGVLYHDFKVVPWN